MVTYFTNNHGWTQTSDSFISIIIEIKCKLLRPPAPVYAHEQPGPAIYVQDIWQLNRFKPISPV